MMLKSRVYLLSSKKLSPETIAVSFAKTSRSPETFSEIADGLNDASSAKFHERWVVGYGHSSVAEHAVLHIAIENVSRLAVECIESNRLASFTEKSTRYQKWSPDAYFVPGELTDPALLEIYTNTCHRLFDCYAQSLAKLSHFFENTFPAEENESNEVHERRIRNLIMDAGRFILPAASLANLGMTANARVLEHAISKMLSHPLQEVREIGEKIKTACLEEVPTLVKYAQAEERASRIRSTVSQIFLDPEMGDLTPENRATNEWCQLVDHQMDGENKVLAAVICKTGNKNYHEAQALVKRMAQGDRIKLADSLLDTLADHEVAPRELEHTSYSFEILIDQGGYAEFKRHRMMTQSSQPLTTRLGYAVPKLVTLAGLEPAYRSAMHQAGMGYEALAVWNQDVASYLVPNGFFRRVLFTMNLREAYAFCRLRAASNAHFSLRRLAQRVAEEIRKVHPLLGSYMQLPNEPWQEIENQNFSSSSG